MKWTDEKTMQVSFFYNFFEGKCKLAQ